jgi:hypothetical protein
VPQSALQARAAPVQLQQERVRQRQAPHLVTVAVVAGLQQPEMALVAVQPEVVGTQPQQPAAAVEVAMQPQQPEVAAVEVQPQQPAAAVEVAMQPQQPEMAAVEVAMQPQQPEMAAGLRGRRMRGRVSRARRVSIFGDQGSA